MQTYWCEPSSHAKSVGTTDTDGMGCMNPEAMDEKTQRLVDWNVEVLAKLIREIIARRNAKKAGKKTTLVSIDSLVGDDPKTPMTTPLAEVKEIIELPEFDACLIGNANLLELDPNVMTQLHNYVAMIAATYNTNRKSAYVTSQCEVQQCSRSLTLYISYTAFHNFDHASHVGMSVAKLLARIVAPDCVIDDGNLASSLHDHTYGITSDPLTQFACVFAALIHDVDHSGVPNTQLVKENAPLATLYGGRSVAEQNSVDIRYAYIETRQSLFINGCGIFSLLFSSVIYSWDLFSGHAFEDLRNAICPTTQEMGRFRQLIVNSVMATDIMDKDSKNLRNARWERAFSESAQMEETSTDQVNRKATIVIEHLIQASDVAVSFVLEHRDMHRPVGLCIFAQH
jgi:hypothetical protein